LGLDAELVVVDTDSGLVRELSAAYVSGHLGHACCLTGHGMQGGTVEQALVLASPRELTAGWSYTALSRARGQTRLLVYEPQLAEERSEFAPGEQRPTAGRRDLLARVQRHMLERDDEELAIEQLPGEGRGDDPEVAASRALARQRFDPMTPSMRKSSDLSQATRPDTTATLSAWPKRAIARATSGLLALGVSGTGRRPIAAQPVGALPPGLRIPRLQAVDRRSWVAMACAILVHRVAGTVRARWRSLDRGASRIGDADLRRASRGRERGAVAARIAPATAAAQARGVEAPNGP
jgi:hypothetical protein